MQSFSQRVLAWFNLYGRTHLPWQQDNDAYQIWLSEIMLQQTQVTTVIPYFNRFIQRFPDVVTLADASLDEVLAHWAGLGYYSRARNLHKAAQIIRDQHCGRFPDAYQAVIALPGIGKSTAGAILSLAFQQRHAILDGNVKRVLSRHQRIDGIPNQSATLKKQWALANRLTPAENCGQYTQAMMDLGAMICTRSKPKCQQCPIHGDCGAYQYRQIDDYPNKKPKKVLPERQTVMLIITDKAGKVYLEKRPDKGIWGGLWSLPEIANNKELDNKELDNKERLIGDFLCRHQLSRIKQYQLSTYRHSFTHYRLFILPWVIVIEDFNNLPERSAAW